MTWRPSGLRAVGVYGRLADLFAYDGPDNQPIGRIKEVIVPAYPDLAWFWTVISLRLAGRTGVNQQAASLSAAQLDLEQAWHQICAP